MLTCTRSKTEHAVLNKLKHIKFTFLSESGYEISYRIIHVCREHVH